RFLYQFSLYANETLNRLEHTPKLTIAALNGHTVGGGLEMALACDVRLAKQGAGRIGLPEVNLGVLPGLGGTQRLAKVVGKAPARRASRRSTRSAWPSSRPTRHHRVPRCAGHWYCRAVGRRGAGRSAPASTSSSSAGCGST